MRDRRIISMLGLVLAGYLHFVDRVTGQERDDQVKWASYVAPIDRVYKGNLSQPPTRPSETLQDAWRIALENDERIKAGGWNVSAADHDRAAAYAESCPSVNIGANALALSDQIAATSPFGSLPLFGQGSVGFHATVTQPIYTA